MPKPSAQRHDNGPEFVTGALRDCATGSFRNSHSPMDFRFDVSGLGSGWHVGAQKPVVAKTVRLGGNRKGAPAVFQ